MDATNRILPTTLGFKEPIGNMTFEMAADGTFDDVPPEPRKEIVTPEVALRHLEEQHPILTELVDKLGLVPTMDDCPF